METKRALTLKIMKLLLPAFVMALIAAQIVVGQNPTMTGDPYAPRGNPRSPDSKYMWVVKTGPSIAYQLITNSSNAVLATVPAYYPQPDPDNLKYAKAYGVFWNSVGTIVALDELNRRRSGELYFFAVQDGRAKQIRVGALIPQPPSAVETRLVVDPGWQSETKIRLRQSVRKRDGDFMDNFYLVDFTNPTRPKIEEAK
jgi:hypothetical protein